MACNRRTQITEYGIQVFLARHREIRQLKRLHAPGLHGFRVWPSSWLLMDFFKRRGLPEAANVMELGCGWGLAGIYCAKRYGALVTGVDIDPEVFPYLRLHARTNQVNIAEITKGFEGLRQDHLNKTDVMIGADICFWDAMVGTLRRLIDRALEGGVRQVIIADPGRVTFNRLADDCVKSLGGEIIESSVLRPYPIEGRILMIGSSA